MLSMNKTSAVNFALKTKLNDFQSQRQIRPHLIGRELARHQQRQLDGGDFVGTSVGSSRNDRKSKKS